MCLRFGTRGEKLPVTDVGIRLMTRSDKPAIYYNGAFNIGSLSFPLSSFSYFYYNNIFNTSTDKVMFRVRVEEKKEN